MISLDLKVALFSLLFWLGCYLKKSRSLSTDKVKASGLALGLVDDAGTDSGSENSAFAIALESTEPIDVEGRARIASIAADRVSL